MAGHYMSDEMLHEIAQTPLDPGTHPYSQLDRYSDHEREIASSVGTQLTPRDGACVAEQLAVCLEILNCEPVNAARIYGEGATSAAQHQLNTILLAHPVLLHPALRVYMVLGSDVRWKGSCSVAHAVALTRHGRLPLESDGYGRSELSAFVNHPCVRMGLTARQPAHHTGLRDAELKTALQTCVGHALARPGFLASLWQLHGLLDPSGEGPYYPNRNLLPESLPEEARKQLPEVFSWSFLGAMNLYQLSQSALGEPTCPEFLAMLSTQDGAMREAVKKALRPMATPAIFGDGGNRLATHVGDAVVRVVGGMVEGGLAEDELAAALWLRDDLPGGLPAVDVPQAMAYVRALASVGVCEFASFFASDEMGYARSKAAATAWGAAVHAHAVETGMKAVIEQGAHAPAREAAARTRRCL